MDEPHAHARAAGLAGSIVIAWESGGRARFLTMIQAVAGTTQTLRSLMIYGASFNEQRISLLRFLPILLSAILLTGCGLRTPEIVIPSDDPNAAAFLVERIIGHVRCELTYAVRYAIWYDVDIARRKSTQARDIAWFDNWGAKLSIKLVIKERSSVNPGLSFINPLPLGQNYTTALGLSGSTQATRTVNLDYFYDFKTQILKGYDTRVPPLPCKPYGEFLIDGDLKIKEFIDMALFPYHLSNNISAKVPDATSQEIEFVIATDANVTPTWKLVRIATSGGTSGMFDVSRSSTDDIIVTLGPTFGGTPSSQLDQAHFLAKQQSNLYSALPRR